MTDFVVNGGDNIGTEGNDTFTLSSSVGDFSINAGGGFDVLSADIAALKDVSWSFRYVESVFLSGSASGATYASFGDYPKTIDTSAVESIIILTAKAGTQNTFVGGETTVVEFSNSLNDGATQSVADFNTGIATITRPGNETVSFNFSGPVIYDCPEISSNIVTGNSADNTISLEKGSHTFNAGAGIDTIYIDYSKVNASVSDFSVSNVGGNLTIEGTGAASVVSAVGTSVERIGFIDANLNITNQIAYDTGIGENAGSAYRVYQAAFARTPDNDGLKYWIGKIDDGSSLYDVAKGFLASQEFQAIYGENPSNEQFVAKLYENVLGRQGEAGGTTYWVGELDSGAKDKATVLTQFSESAENVAAIAPTIDDGIFVI